MATSSPADPARVVEAAYGVDRDDRTWLQERTQAAADCLGPGICIAALSIVDIDAGVADLDASAFVGFGDDELERCRGDFAAAPRMVNSVFARTRCATSSQLVGRPDSEPAARASYLEYIYPRDCIGIVAANPDQTGITPSTYLPEPTMLSHALVRNWDRVAVPVAAAKRPRGALNEAPTTTDVGEAVGTADGRIVYAEGAAKAATHREALREAARAVDRARGARRRRDPDEALALWRGLVAGRWTLVDRFESDGRRCYVAHRNDPAVPDPRALTLRERQVAALAALGDSDKRIAYALGLARSTVASSLASARRKLGVHSRAALIQLVGDLARSEGNHG